MTTFQDTWPHARRDGDALHFWAGAKPKPGYEFYLTYQPGSGQLLLTDPAGPGVRILLHKVSASTAVPSPFPLPSSMASTAP